MYFASLPNLKTWLRAFVPPKLLGCVWFPVESYQGPEKRCLRPFHPRARR